MRDKNFCLKVLRKQNGPKTNIKIQNITPKKVVNGGKLCIFAFKNPNLAQSLKNVALPYGCTVAPFRNSLVNISLFDLIVWFILGHFIKFCALQELYQFGRIYILKEGHYYNILLYIKI